MQQLVKIGFKMKQMNCEATVDCESLFEVALVSFVYKRIVWNVCSRDDPFGKEDCVNSKP